MWVQSIQMAVAKATSGLGFGAQCTGRVLVQDAAGRAVSGVTVTASFSHATVFGFTTGPTTVLIPSPVTAVTDASGVARFVSPVVQSTGGKFTLSVTNLTRSGYTYRDAGRTVSQAQSYSGLL
jgi:hypothetical protein